MNDLDILQNLAFPEFFDEEDLLSLVSSKSENIAKLRKGLRVIAQSGFVVLSIAESTTLDNWPTVILISEGCAAWVFIKSRLRT